MKQRAPFFARPAASRKPAMKHTRLIARSLPNALLEIIPGDHFVARTHPEDFRRAVEAFLLS